VGEDGSIQRDVDWYISACEEFIRERLDLADWLARDMAYTQKRLERALREGSVVIADLCKSILEGEREILGSIVSAVQFNREQINERRRQLGRGEEARYGG